MIILTGNTPSKKNAKQMIFSKKKILRAIDAGCSMAEVRRIVDKTKPLLISNKNYYLWEKENLWRLKSFKGKYTTHVEVHLTFFRKSKHKWDWNNISQAVTDILVKAEILIDDDATHCTPVNWGWAYDKENPRCEVDIIICEGREIK